MTALLPAISTFWVRTVCEILSATYGSKHARNLFPTWHLCVITLVTRKLYVVYEHCSYWMNVLISKISIFRIKAGCEIRLVNYGSKHSSQFFPISHLYVFTRITWQLRLYMDVQHIEWLLYYHTHFLCGLSCKRDPSEKLRPQTCIDRSLIQLVCVYCKPVFTSLFGTQLLMTVVTHVP